MPRSLIAVAICGVLGTSLAQDANPKQKPAVIAAERWQTVEVPDRIRCLLPGQSKRVTQPVPGVAGVQLAIYSCQPDKDSIYSVGYMEGELPAARRGLPADVLLNDACDGAMKNAQKQGAIEASRESIQLGSYPGKQLISDIPRARARAVTRIYLAHGRIYMAIAGAVGLETDHANVKRLFESFEILETGIAHNQPALSERVEKELPSALDTYKAIHATPELSHYEEKTAALVANELKAVGCDVFTGIGKFTKPEWKGHGVAGVLKNGDGPVVLIRAELDALPITEQTGLSYASKVRVTTDRGTKTGVMHACGHDLHLAAMLGTARLLAAQKGRWRGTVVFVAQPAEETLDGVKAMLADGLFKKVPRPNYCLALHCIGDLSTGEVGITPGPALASVQVLEITVRGKGGHGSRPHEAKDPIVVAAQVILALQTIVSRETSALEPVVVTVGAIQGGNKANIIPEEVRLLVSVRALDDKGRDRAIRAVERIVKGTAQAAGIPDDLAPIVRRSEDEKVSGTYNDPALSERLSAVFARELGGNKVLRIKPRMAGDDFAHFGSVEGKVIPSLVYLLGTADPQKTEEGRRTSIPLVSVHNPRFAPIPGITLRTGMRTMTSAVLDLLKTGKPGK